MSNSLDPDQDHNLSGLIWIQTVFMDYQLMTKVATKKVVEFLKKIYRWNLPLIMPAGKFMLYAFIAIC